MRRDVIHNHARRLLATLKDGPLSNKGPSAFYRVGILQRKHFTAANIL